MMRRFLIWSMAFALMTAAVFGLCVWMDTGVRTADVQAVIPEDANVHSYVLTGWKMDEKSAFLLELPARLKDEPFELVFSEMNAFSVYCNDALLYSYDTADGYERLHVVPLPKNADGIYRLRVETGSLIGRNRILLASESESVRIYQLAYGVNAATMGMFALTIFYSLTLYARKRTEKYLLLLAMLSVIALISAVSNSTLSLPGFHNISEPVRFLRVTFCAALCPILMGSRLPGRWNRLYGWPGIFGVSLLLYLLYAFGFRQISNLLAYLLAIPALLACADGCARRVPYAGAFSAGVVIREALRIFYCFIQTGDLVCPPIFYYYYIPQMSSFIFVLSCMLLINGRFADKFRQVDLLADKLETANTHLDEKVTVRTLELQCANERLTLEQDRKRNMMMNIFHDLRTPIFAAIGMAEKICPTDERSARSLDILDERLNFLSHLTEELFFLAKLEEGKITFERFRVRLDDFCPPIASAFEGMAAKKGLAFTFSLEPGLMITGDAFRIKQALENLLSNAVKYTDAGRIDFSVCALNGFAVFSVRDTGPGIPPEALPKLFERYYQGNLARGPESAGLGLSIVLAIAQGNGGEVDVRSEPGIGSCFMLKIPLEQ